MLVLVNSDLQAWVGSLDACVFVEGVGENLPLCCEQPAQPYGAALDAESFITCLWGPGPASTPSTG